MREKKLAIGLTAILCLVTLLIPASGCSFFERGKKLPIKVVKKVPGPLQAIKAERIAFQKDGNIWTMKQDGTDKKELVSSAELEFSLSYSKEANRIWFIRTTSTTWQPLAVGDVYSMKTDGTDVKQVTSGLNARFAAVSPDGQKIGVSVKKNMPELGGNAESWDLWIMDANGTAQTETAEHTDLTGDLPASGVGGREGSTFCSWSPDSQKIVFTFKADGSASLGISTRQVYIASKDGSGRKNIAGSVDYPAVSPNQKYVALDEGAHWDMIGLKIITINGADYKQVEPVPTGELYSVDKPAWVGNNKVTYAVTTHPSDPTKSVTTLYVADLSKPNVIKKEIANQSQVGGVPKNPAVNSMGTKIVFQADSFYAQGGETTTYVWIVNTDGNSLVKLTTGPEDGNPIWIK